MAVYFIGTFEIDDLDAYATYRPLAEAAIADHGGRYLVRGGDLEVIEGEAPLPRVVVLEFASREHAMAWYNSEAYQKALPIRLGASHGSAFLVDGYEP